jgi:hypothetical protein
MKANKAVVALTRLSPRKTRIDCTIIVQVGTGQREQSFQ